MLVGISIVTYVTNYFVTTVTQLTAPTSANATENATIPNKHAGLKIAARQ